VRIVPGAPFKSSAYRPSPFEKQKTKTVFQTVFLGERCPARNHAAGQSVIIFGASIGSRENESRLTELSVLVQRGIVVHCLAGFELNKLLIRLNFVGPRDTAIGYQY